MTAAQEKVKAIHSAVDMASDVLLQDAPYELGQLQTVRELGFINSENARDIEDFNANNNFARLYRQTYPHYKFITDHQLDKIRKTYNLMEGNLSSFKGNIPAKNIADMQNCKIAAGDIQEPEQSITGTLGVLMDEYSRIMRSSMFSPSMLPSAMQGVRSGKSFSSGGFADNRREIDDLSTGRHASIRDYETVSSRWMREMDENPFAHRPHQMLSFKEIVAHYPLAVKITAERALFDLPARELDPIVTVAVKGGYLIITAWGLEASDPDVQNPAMN